MVHLLQRLDEVIAHALVVLALFLGLLLFPFLAPLPLEAGQLGGFQRIADVAAAFDRAAIGAETGRRAVAQHEHQQAVIVDHAAADQLAVGIDRHFLAIERALHGDVFELLDAECQRGLPGLAKAGAFGVAAQEVGAFGRHVDAVRGGLDAAGIGQRGDEIALALFGPAIVALILAGDGEEGGQLARAGAAAALVDGHGRSPEAGEGLGTMLRKGAVGK